MRVTLHWRGKPLLALDLTAQSPDDEPDDDGPAFEASGALQDSTIAEPTQPDTVVFGISARPESQYRA